MRIRSLGWEDALEEGMATHSSILAWRILWTVETGGLQSIGSQRLNRLSKKKKKSHYPYSMERENYIFKN